MSQKSLGAFGFKKSILHRGIREDIALSGDANENPFPCTFPNCPQRFKSKKGRTQHAIAKHGSTSSAILQPSQVDEDVIEESSDDDIQEIKPKLKRKKYDCMFKLDVLDFIELNPSETDNDIAAYFHINPTQVCRWKKQKQLIQENAANFRRIHKFRKSGKHDKLFTKLYEKMLHARSRGVKVSHSWLWSKARQIQNELSDGAETVNRHIVWVFVQKYNIKLRRKQRSKTFDKEKFRDTMMKWHSTTRERLIKTPSSPSKWGRFEPKQRLNVDQVPLPFSLDCDKTYEVPSVGKYDKVWIRQPGAGLEKRQCTLQLCFSPDAKMKIKPSIIFRGQGKVSKNEIDAYHQDVDIYWQGSAWADSNFCSEWANKTLRNAIGDISKFLLFCDNLAGQVSVNFKETVSSLGGVVWYGPPKSTDLWQPVDAGYGRLFKNLIAKEYHAYLDSCSDFEFNQISARERRILTTQWVGKVWNNIHQEGSIYNECLWRYFEKTGCLITADGSDDDKISPEGVKDYKVPKPVEFIEPPKDPVLDDPPQAESNESVQSTEIYDEEEVEERIDDENSRLFDYENVGRKIKALYDSGWHIGEIKYYNVTLAEYKIDFEDGSVDYISLDEIDGIEILLI